jgi:hypothetical protein
MSTSTATAARDSSAFKGYPDRVRRSVLAAMDRLYVEDPARYSSILEPWEGDPDAFARDIAGRVRSKMAEMREATT